MLENIIPLLMSLPATAAPMQLPSDLSARATGERAIAGMLRLPEFVRGVVDIVRTTTEETKPTSRSRSRGNDHRQQRADAKSKDKHDYAESHD